MSVDRPGESGSFAPSTASPDETSHAPDEGLATAQGAGDPTAPLGPNGVDGLAAPQAPVVSEPAPGSPPTVPGAPAPFVDLEDVEAPVPGAKPPAALWRRPRRTRVGRPRKPAEGRWVNYRVRTVGPMSVLRLAGLFYLCVWLALVVAGVVLWNVGRSTETIDQFEGFITRLGAYGECVPEDSLDPGTDFERDDDCPDGSVLVDGFKFDDGVLFRATFFGGIVLVVGGTLLTVLVVMLYNLLSEVTGGVRYTATREPRHASIRSPGPRMRR
jgi:hypothetical protein